MWYEWFFNGIGTEIISSVFGLVVGLFLGYRICIRKNGLQKQKGRNKAVQRQEIEIELDEKEKDTGLNGNFKQIQKGGESSKQTQIGRIRS